MQHGGRSEINVVLHRTVKIYLGKLWKLTITYWLNYLILNNIPMQKDDCTNQLNVFT